MSSKKSSSMPTEGKPLVCYAPTMVTTNGVWQGDNPLDYSLPLFIFQLTLAVVLTRILVFVLKPLRQPRVIGEILAGIITGPSVLGAIEDFSKYIFPLRSVMVLETMANIGLIYFLFLVGVEMDLTVIRQTGKKAVSIAIGGMILPFAIGGGFSFLLPAEKGALNTGHLTTYILFVGVTLAVTTFPVLARMLAELKLINTEIGQIAMSAAIVNDLCAWILLALAISLSGPTINNRHLTSLWVISASIAFVAFCIFVVRPLIKWMIRRTPEGEPISDFHITLILMGVMVCGFVTDAIGTHSVFGAFVFGLIIPNETLGMTLIEKLEDFVSGLLLPIFFALNGLKTDIYKIVGFKPWLHLLLATVFAYTGKVVGTTAISHFYNIPLREGIALGFLMNTKGLLEIVVLNVGLDQRVLDEATFSVMVIGVVLMTAIVGPLVRALYRSTRGIIAYKRRTLESTKLDTELRILSCIHNPRNVPSLVSLLAATHPTKRSPLCVYVLHLIELTGRASAMLIVHNTHKTSSSSSATRSRTQAQSDHIFSAFESYEQQGAGAAGCVAIQPLTAISPYSSMHEDICSLAEDKRVSFIILPFHKQQTVDGGMESTNPAFRTINQNVLANAPCSVGILVDRGLSSSGLSVHHVAVLFFGGPDDREALSYAWRMSDNPGIYLTVVRLIPGPDAISRSNTSESATNILGEASPDGMTVVIDIEKERRLDEEYLNEFRAKTVAMSNNESITYVERVVNNGEETVAAIRAIDSTHDLYIVGRGQGMISPLVEGLTDWSECPELGAIGDLLASSDFTTSVSVLVVQQYVGTHNANDGTGVAAPNSPFGINNRQLDFDHHLNMNGDGYHHMNNRRPQNTIFKPET